MYDFQISVISHLNYYQSVLKQHIDRSLLLVEQQLTVFAEWTTHLLHKVLLAPRHVCKYVQWLCKMTKFYRCQLDLHVPNISAALLELLNANWWGKDADKTHMLSWMNLLILLLVYFSSVNFTELSSNMLLSRGGRNRTTPLSTKNRKCHCSPAAPTAAVLITSNVYGIGLFGFFANICSHGLVCKQEWWPKVERATYSPSMPWLWRRASELVWAKR